METPTPSVYDELEPPAPTDKIEHWFDLSSRSDTVEPHQSITLIGARAQLQHLVDQRDWLARELAAVREAHQGACETIAQMHKAAVGEVRGPIRGVVEDVEDLRARCLAAEGAAGRALNVDMAALYETRQQQGAVATPTVRLDGTTDGNTR